MKNSQKARTIVVGCMLAVGILSSIIIWRNFRPSPGKPYEVISLEQANAFMAYETGYVLVDIGTEEEFLAEHLDGAVNIPYENLGKFAATMLPDKGQQIYLYGRDEQQNEMAARKLCELGYTNLSEIEDAL